MPKTPSKQKERGENIGALKAAALAILATPILLAIAARADALSEYQVKAGFILNIVRFTEWPAQMPGTNGKLLICAIGSEPWKEALDTLTGKEAKGKTLEIRYLGQYDRIEGCNALFVGESARRQIPRILKQTDGGATLTISEVENFVDQGGMVDLLVEKNHAVLEINNASVRKANLKISSQVLKYARRVID